MMYISFPDPSVVGGSLSGHTDAVWGLTFHAQRHHLLSCGADSTVRLWSADARNPLLYTYAVEKGIALNMFVFTYMTVCVATYMYVYIRTVYLNKVYLYLYLYL